MIEFKSPSSFMNIEKSGRNVVGSYIFTQCLKTSFRVYENVNRILNVNLINSNGSIKKKIFDVFVIVDVYNF